MLIQASKAFKHIQKVLRIVSQKCTVNCMPCSELHEDTSDDMSNVHLTLNKQQKEQKEKSRLDCSDQTCGWVWGCCCSCCNRCRCCCWWWGCWLWRGGCLRLSWGKCRCGPNGDAGGGEGPVRLVHTPVPSTHFKSKSKTIQTGGPGGRESKGWCWLTTLMNWFQYQIRCLRFVNDRVNNWYSGKYKSKN